MNQLHESISVRRRGLIVSKFCSKLTENISAMLSFKQFLPFFLVATFFIACPLSCKVVRITAASTIGKFFAFFQPLCQNSSFESTPRMDRVPLEEGRCYKCSGMRLEFRTCWHCHRTHHRWILCILQPLCQNSSVESTPCMDRVPLEEGRCYKSFGMRQVFRTCWHCHRTHHRWILCILQPLCQNSSAESTPCMDRYLLVGCRYFGLVPP